MTATIKRILARALAWSLFIITLGLIQVLILPWVLHYAWAYGKWVERFLGG